MIFDVAMQTGPILGNADGVTSRFDEAGRMYEAQKDVFLATGVSLPSGRAITHTGGGLASNSTTNSNTATVTLTTGGSSYVLARNVFDRAGRTIDRDIKSIDAIGNFALKTFDPGGRVIQAARTGLIGGPSPTTNLGTGNVVLSGVTSRFDEAGRMYELQRDVFLATGVSIPSGRTITHTGGGLATNSTTNSNTATVTLTSGGGSYVLARNVFDRAGRTIAQAADNGALTNFSLDGASRTFSTQDALGNRLDNVLDGNGNVVASTRTEFSTLLSAPVPEIFRSAMRFDSLNRLVLTAQQGADGNITSDLTLCCANPTPASTLVSLAGFDSRGNRTLSIDAKGNTTVAVFDGASRQTQTLVHMRLGGSGPNPPAGNTSFLESGRGVIRTDVVLDGNGRITKLIDDRGGATAFGYDSLDRQVTMTFQDGSVRTNIFNAAGDIVGYTDENGSFFAFTFDAAGRRVAVAITRATGVGGTTSQDFEYDGLSRMTLGQDNVGGDAHFFFDSLGRTLEEVQNANEVTHHAWASYPATGFTFPVGRQLTLGNDILYRKNAIHETSDSSLIADWQFFGNRVATVTLGNGLICSFMNNAQSRSAIQSGQPTPPWSSATTDHLGYDGASRVAAKRYLMPSGGGSPGPATLVVGFTTEYDRASNKLYERHLHAESRSHLYPAYDSPDRLLQYQRGILATGGATITTPISLPGTDSQRSYALDGLGNWNNTASIPVGGAPTTEYRRHNYLNQITRFGSTPVLYDHGNNAASTNPNVKPRGNGNIIDDGKRLYQFDALNRLIQVKRKSDGLVIAAYTYDALGRRMTKTVSNGGLSGTVPNGAWTYTYSGWQIVEEYTGVVLHYVWGQYIDELIQMKAIGGTVGPQSLPDGAYYLLSDLLYRSAALTNSSGVVVEAYDTDAYGNTLLFSGPGPDGLWFTNDDVQADYSACRYVFTGREFDAEVGNHFYRARRYHPDLGRFGGRDPLLFTDGMNLYAFVSGRPASLLDPLGLDTGCEITPDCFGISRRELGVGSSHVGSKWVCWIYCECPLGSVPAFEWSVPTVSPGQCTPQKADVGWKCCPVPPGEPQPCPRPAPIPPSRRPRRYVYRPAPVVPAPVPGPVTSNPWFWGAVGLVAIGVVGIILAPETGGASLLLTGAALGA